VHAQLLHDHRISDVSHACMQVSCIDTDTYNALPALPYTFTAGGTEVMIDASASLQLRMAVA
jgi:hypothetical protein